MEFFKEFHLNWIIDHSLNAIFVVLFLEGVE